MTAELARGLLRAAAMRKQVLAWALAGLLAAGCGGSIGSQDPGDDDGDADAGPGGPGDADGGDCPSVVASLDPVIPTVMLLLDQSGSMSAGYGGGLTRYQAMVEALANPTSGVVAQLAGQVKFGASLYTSHGGNAGGTCPILQTVAPAMDNYAAIDALLRGNGPDGDTPTGESISAVTQVLLGIPVNPDDGPSPLVIVVATDGEPDTCAVPNPQQGQPESIAAAQAAYAAGVRLYMLGVGDEVGAPHLQDMANAGAGLPVGGATNAPYYQANDPAALVAAFQQIVNGVRECTFTVDGTVDLAQAPFAEVVLNGVVLGYQDPNGWHMVDEHTLQLDGAACDTFKNDPSVNFSATFPCGAIIE